MFKKNLQQAAERQKKYYETGLKPREISSEDFVWRWYPPTAGFKLGFGWVGSYKVIDKITDVTYETQKFSGSDYIVVHVDHLKPYEGILPPLNLAPQVSFTEESVLDHGKNFMAKNLHLSLVSLFQAPGLLSRDQELAVA